MLGEWWTKQDADAIADKLTEIALDIDSPEMAGKRRKAAESKQQTIAAGEQAIRDWFPNHGAIRDTQQVHDS